MRNSFLYMQLYNDFKEKIDNNIWTEGMQLPPEYQIMKDYNLSRDTVRKSLQKLAEEGYIYRKAGKGTFVERRNPKYKAISFLEGFIEKMKDRDLKASSRILDIGLEVPSNTVRNYLQMSEEEMVYKLERLMLANGEPMCHEIVYIPEKSISDLDIIVDNDTSLFKIYEEHCNLESDYGELYIESKGCSGRYSHHLNIAEGEPILEIKCILYTERKKSLCFVESHYIGEKYTFFTNISRIKRIV